MKWTPKQQEVINARGCNLLVSAAAGSGKTAVLVERIIHLICDEENPIDIDRLLVMTFTSAAAGEMRERILKAIEEKLAKDPAQEHLQVQAALVHRAQITTIDSFCLSLIRDHFNLLDIDPAFRIGDEGELFVIRVNDVEGYATLSKKKVDANKAWEVIEAATESREVMEGFVTEENKGGVVVSVKGVRVFVPASQSGLPRDAAMTELVKKKVQLRITEVNRARRRVVGSIKAVQQEARAAAAAEVWANIEVGKRYTGTVKSMTSYGVFVDIGGVDGMVHITDLSWSRIKHPNEVVSIGETLDVYVISFDPEKKKISLGVKDRSTNPWQVFMDTYKVGDVANVRVVKLMTFGAFAEVVPGVDGLIHISQIADHRIEKPGDELSEGQMVDAKITAVDEEKQKISLSIRALLAPTPAPADEEPVEA